MSKRNKKVGLRLNKNGKLMIVVNSLVTAYEAYTILSPFIYM